MDNQQERLAFDKGWLIGIIDGEGSFILSYKRRGYYPQIQLGNTNHKIVEKARTVLVNNDISPYIAPPRILKSGKIFKRIDIGGLLRVYKFFKAFPIELFESRFEEAKCIRDYVNVRWDKTSHCTYGKEELEIVDRLKKVKS